MTTRRQSRNDPRVGMLEWYGFDNLEEAKNYSNETLVDPLVRQFMEENGWSFELGRELSDEEIKVKERQNAERNSSVPGDAQG